MKRNILFILKNCLLMTSVGDPAPFTTSFLLSAPALSKKDVATGSWLLRAVFRFFFTRFYKFLLPTPAPSKNAWLPAPNFWLLKAFFKVFKPAPVTAFAPSKKAQLPAQKRPGSRLRLYNTDDDQRGLDNGIRKKYAILIIYKYNFILITQFSWLYR